MRKRNETRKFRKLRKGSKKYSTHRNKSGGGLGTFVRSFTSDGRLLEEFKKKIRDVTPLRILLDTPDGNLENSEIMDLIRVKVLELKMANNAYKVNYDRLKSFVDDNNERLSKILGSLDMQIEKRDFYLKVLEEVGRLGEAVVGDFSMGPAAAPLPPAADAHYDMTDNGAGVGDSDAGDVIKETTFDGAKASVITNRRCPTNTDKGVDQYFTCDYVTEGQKIPLNARCKFCFKSKREHTQQGQGQGQGGGSRRRRRNTRSRKNKTRRNGKCRACRCPGGCKRSTCPCYRGRSKPCCTKRCRSRGRICRC